MKKTLKLTLNLRLKILILADKYKHKWKYEANSFYWDGRKGTVDMTNDARSGK